VQIGVMAASGAEISRLLVLSADASSAQHVLDKLRGLCGDGTALAVASGDAAGVQKLMLRTKYYSAEVEAHAHAVRDNAPVAELAHDLHEYEAVLCVVNPSDRESFVHVRGLLERLAETEQFDVCLLVGDTRPDAVSVSKKLQPIDRAHLGDWCQDNTFEFVSLDEDGNQEGDEETRGIDRVLEALQCNMWKSMVRGPPPSVKVVLPSAAKAESARDIEEITAASGNQTEDDAVEDNSDARLQTLLRALEITEKEGESATSAPSVDNERAESRIATGREEEDDDVDMAQFSALIDQVRRVREQGQALTDEERRQQAAEVAMRLWNFLDVDDEGDSSSE
jgi:hypothetical protein